MKRICFLTLLLVQLFCIITHADGYTFFNPRSQSVNAARELVGWQKFINTPCHDDSCCYTSFSAAAEYTQSFYSKKLAEYFFECPTRVFSGSLVSSRGEHDILADYFGLPTDFKSSVTFKPRVQNFLVDFDWYQSLDTLCPGSYVRVHAPLVYALWGMNLCEFIEQEGTNAYPAGYMASEALERQQLSTSVAQAFCRNTRIGDIQPLTAGRICCGKRTKTNIAEVQVVVGHNPILCDNYHFGWNVRASIPTGGRSRADYLFEPIIGNGGHWEAGFGLTGHATVWTCSNQSCAIYSDLNVTHLFTARQRRSFDFCNNRSLSRYMLLEQMSTPLVSGLGVNTGTPVVEVPAEQQYSGRLIPAVNETTLWANISIGAQADFVIKAEYTYKNFSFDIGYDAWIRSHEKMHCRQQFPSDSFAIKGDAQVYGFDLVDPSFFIALNATEHLATIHAGQAPGNIDFTNENVDNAGPAIFGGIPLVTADRTNAVNSSAQAILLNDDDINNASGLAPKATSHTLFVHANYDWQTCNGTTPFIGCGACVQFGSNNHHKATALSQWGIWLKAGFNR